MISNLFDRVTRLSLRFRWVTIAATVVVLIGGVFAMLDLNLELLPRIELPSTVVFAQWADAESSENFLEAVTIPLEERLRAVEGVLSVESTTNSSLAYFIVLSDFGLNQDKLLADIDEAVAGVNYPEGMETPQVLNFGFSDLPVVRASVSSEDLTLAELKQLVENDLQPRLENVADVSAVGISGGQELPEEVTVNVADTEAATGGSAAGTTGEVEEESPGRLPVALIEGAKSLGVDVEYVQDVTPDLLAGIEGTKEEIMAVLAMIPPELLPYAPPETLAMLPSEYMDSLDADLLQELDGLAADYGGIRQYNLEQVMALLAGEEPEQVLAEESGPEEATATAEAEVPTTQQTEEEGSKPEVSEEVLPEVEPVDLPDSWITAASAAGFDLTTTADIGADVMEAIVGFAPQLLADLEPQMWRALAPDAIAIGLPVVDADMEPSLLAQLQAIQGTANGVEPDPVPLPESWISAAGAAGFSLETTADVPAEAMTQLASFAPQLLQDLTDENLLAFAPDVLSALPEEYVAGLDEGLGQTIRNISIWYARSSAVASAGEESGSPAQDPARLPDMLVQGARAAGQEIEFAQDVSPDLIRMLAGFGEQGNQFLAMLTPDNLRLLPPESIALLPAAFLDTLDADLRAELDELAAEYGGAGQLAIDEAKAADPARLPEALIQIAGQFGFELEYAQDITPEFIRPLAAAGDQASQLLALLTPDNLRLLQPEVIALLPMSYLDTLDAELRTELDELAADYGGAGQLAISEAEAAAATSAESPPLAGIWLEPGPNGEESLFQTAGDLLNNQFMGSAAGLLNVFPNSPNVENPVEWMQALSPEVMQYLAENEEGFVENLSPTILEMMSPETLTFLLDTYPDAFDEDTTQHLRGVAAGSIEVFVPEASITRTDGNPSLIVNLFKAGDANTVEVAHGVFDELDAYEEENPDVRTNLVFEQATFIEDSIRGVAREGALGAVFAVVVILLFLSGHVGGKYKLSWRATLVTGTSIPLSVFTAFLLMRGVPTVGTWMQGLVESTGNGFLTFVSRLFPTNVTLNIMTLSGLTVAIGRVVDDSIVVLENSYRFIQRGEDPKQAVIQGTKEVAIAIFSATATTVAVFLPLGLIGGIIGSFFLPFGLTVTYALAASFVVSITVVPALTYLLIRREHIPEERETTMQRWYTPILSWALNHRFYTMLIATLIFFGSLFLLQGLPRSFIPSIGEPTINVGINLPNGTTMVETDELVAEFESSVKSLDGLGTVQTEIGSSGGFEAMFFGGSISQNVANVTIEVQGQDGLMEQEELLRLTNEVRNEAYAIFGEENVNVSAASQAGFGGFSMVVTGDSQDELMGIVDDVKEALGSVDHDGDGVADIANVSSSVDNGDGATRGDSTILRVDGRPAISFSGELETENTLGVTSVAKQAIIDRGLPAGVEVTEGFESELQVEGFRNMIVAIGYSIIIVYLIMALTFRSPIHPFTILFSLPFALVGAALALFISKSVLGISAMIGLMMLVGIVVTNGIVLMELVQQLRRRGRNAYDALIQGGRTRLRPIWMTALAAILALIPLGLSQEAGAIIASELALVVMGGLLVSTALTLVVIPVVYSGMDDLGGWLQGMLRGRRGKQSG